MNKVLRIGRLKQVGDLFLKVEFKDGKLSISGVEGPMSNGNARGSCGQIEMGYSHRNPDHNDKRYSNPTKPDEIEFAPGWEADKWLELLEIWHNWHLNDMKPNCVHQVGPEWTSKDVTLYHFRLLPEISKAQEQTKRYAIESVKAGKPFFPTDEQCRLAILDYSLTWHEPTLPAKLAPFYEPKKPLYNGDSGPTETKATGWLGQDEHPEGFLSKPCPVCGYKYGSQWRKEEVPQTVIAFLQSLPDADKQPAWV